MADSVREVQSATRERPRHAASPRQAGKRNVPGTIASPLSNKRNSERRGTAAENSEPAISRQSQVIAQELGSRGRDDAGGRKRRSPRKRSAPYAAIGLDDAPSAGQKSIKLTV